MAKPSRAESYSRYSEGHRCRWRRLLTYHLNDKGISPTTPQMDLLVGSTLHKCLEAFVSAPPGPPSPDVLAELAAPSLTSHRDTVTRMLSEEEAEVSTTMCEALSYGWARVVLPWLHENFNILLTEKMMKQTIQSVDFYAVPDLVTEHKQSGVIAVHDYKSVSYWDDDSASRWDYSIQQYLTAHLVSLHLSKPVPEYYIHPLNKGKEPKYPSPLYKPWVAPAVTPMGSPSFSTSWKKNFTRDLVSKHTTTQKFIWDLPLPQLMKLIQIAGPFNTNTEIALDFIDGAVTEHHYWHENLRDLEWSEWEKPEFQAKLVRRFPRSYSCWDFNKLCPFHSICFRREGWQKPYENGFEPRSFVK